MKFPEQRQPSLELDDITDNTTATIASVNVDDDGITSLTLDGLPSRLQLTLPRLAAMVRLFGGDRHSWRHKRIKLVRSETPWKQPWWQLGGLPLATIGITAPDDSAAFENTCPQTAPEIEKGLDANNHGTQPPVPAIQAEGEAEFIPPDFD